MKVPTLIEKLKPYAPGKPIEETKREYGLIEVVKLASNENPLGPSKKVKLALQEAMQEIHRYPDGAAFNLKQKCVEYYDVPEDQILFGNGSNELIDLLIRVYCQPDDSIITSQSAFIAYKICAQAASVHTVEIPYDKNYVFDFEKLESFLEETTEQGNKLVFVPNPNNPTGTYVDAKTIERFVQKFSDRDDVLIVFDEAYCEYVRASDFASALPLVNKYPNVVVLRTMSKAFGLAALRVGTLFAPKEVVSYLNRIRMPFNVSSLAQAGAIAALEDQEYVLKSKELNGEGLDYFYRELEALGVKYVESQGNFVFFDTRIDSRLFCEEMLKRGVILRPLLPYGFSTELRMSVGLPEENQRAIDVMKEVLKTLGQ